MTLKVVLRRGVHLDEHDLYFITLQLRGEGNQGVGGPR